MNVAFEKLKERAINAVKNNNIDELLKVCDRKDVITKIGNKNDKLISKDILNLSEVICNYEGKDYSLIGLAIKNVNPTMLRMLSYLGCNPLFPAYKENDKEVSVLSYIKEKTEEVKKDFDLSIDMGEINYAFYKNHLFSITPDVMLDNFQKHSKGEINDLKLFETIFFYKYDIVDCEFEFETEKQKYYPMEYLLKKHKKDLLDNNYHKLKEDALIPFHGIDVETLVDKVTAKGYIMKTETLGKQIISKNGKYPLEVIDKSIAQEEKYLKSIEMQKPNMNWAR